MLLASCSISLIKILTPFFFSAVDSSAALWYLREKETTLTSGDSKQSVSTNSNHISSYRNSCDMLFIFLMDNIFVAKYNTNNKCKYIWSFYSHSPSIHCHLTHRRDPLFLAEPLKYPSTYNNSLKFVEHNVIHIRSHIALLFLT